MPVTRRPWLRPLAMRLHRWVALALGLWFGVLGLTGALLVWHAEVDRALNPAWFAPLPGCGRVEARPIAASLDLFHRQVQSGTAIQILAPVTPGAAYVVVQKPGADGLRRQHFVDANCGRYLGSRVWGAARIDRAHFVPAVYELHRSLLSKEAGHVAVGLAGLAFLFVAVSGIVTAWPRHASREAWKRTLSIKQGASRHRFFYDLHRAAGTWLFGFLLLMTLTGAYLCFPKQGRALVAMALPTQPADMREAGTVPENAGRDLDALVRKAQSLWPDTQWTRVQLQGKPPGAYDVRLLQRSELRVDTGDTRVRMSMNGRVVDIRDPLKAPGGDQLLSWLFPLHSGEALGLIGRLAWTLFGFGPVLLFATGLWLWLRRSGSRQQHLTVSRAGRTDGAKH